VLEVDEGGHDETGQHQAIDQREQRRLTAGMQPRYEEQQAREQLNEEIAR
jgi:hypothetical protein